MHLKLKALLLAALFSLVGCSAESDVEVYIKTNEFWGTLVFVIQATTDEAVVKKVVINRGNCELPEGTALDIKNTVKLGFGKRYTGYSNNCTVNDVREIQVTTNAGTFEFEF